MSRFVNRLGQFTVDLGVLTVAFIVAFGLRFDFDPSPEMLKRATFLYPYVLMLELFVLSLLGIPRFAWRYVGLREVGRIAAATAIVATVLLILRFGGAMAAEGIPAAKYSIVPIGVIVINATLVFLGIVGVRVGRRLLYEKATAGRHTPSNERSPVLLVGAGRAGVQVARELQQRPDLGLRAVGFIDNDPVKKNTEIHGLKVLGSSSELKEICAQVGVEEIIITIASANGATLRQLIRHADASGVKAKIIPGIGDILNGNINLSRIRPIRIEDLLGRDAVYLETDLVGTMLRSKRVLVTGAGGSIGSELCRQIAQLQPAAVILVERAEPALFTISQELGQSFPSLRTEATLCDVTDTARLDAIFDRFRPDVVFHAAAHKHVPLMEQNPGEAIKNNIFGTINVANAVHRFGPSSMVLVSTDKAVNPTSIMGATKRIAEMYVQAMSGRSDSRYVAVRFGNVLGSTGSVIPTFQKQIEQGGPVTVTHPDMKRYFMTIPEASQLVMQAGAMGHGGEIFVLDMGEPVHIKDLAEDLIRLSGLEPEVDVAIEYCGVRPGEKLFEELGFDAEKMNKTRHRKIYIGRQATTEWEPLQAALSVLAELGGAWNREDVEAALRRIVPEMIQPASSHGPRTETPALGEANAMMGQRVPSLDPA